MIPWFTHYRARRLEWSLSMFTVVFGTLLMLPHVSMATPGYSPVLALLDERDWGLVHAVTGLCHMMALHVNGRGRGRRSRLLGRCCSSCQPALENVDNWR